MQVLRRGGYTAPLVETLVTIAVDDDLSPAIDITGASFGGIVVPATNNGTSIGFTVSADGTTFATLTDADNAAITITCTNATAAAFPLPPELFAFNYFKISPGQQADTNTQYVVSLKG